MIKIGIVILNYLAYQTTIDTVSSFDLQDKEGFEVFYVIVDNCSPNESYEKLKKAYRGRKDIAVVRTGNNLGFANGNNFGYKQLLLHMKPDFTIISNDDILLPQQGLYKWIVQCSREYKFAVLGPDVYSVSGKFHQSPLENHSRDIHECRKEYNELRKKYIKCLVKKFLKISGYQGTPVWKNDAYDKFTGSMTLHGSFQVFSNIYFRKYSQPYDTTTFLYMEEDILKLRCDRHNLKMIYSPDYQVHHLQAIATNMINKTNYDKELFRRKHLIHSFRSYMALLKKLG
ncbi:MAG: glycosyltransferase family 2 protein [Ruminococcus sp.]|nr:glycosyltransferase family 2 protein [Ruminococcus sp.]